MLIIPMVHVNGSDEIGIGWSSYIANYSPRDIVGNVRHLLNGEPMEVMDPWYKGFSSTIEKTATKESGEQDKTSVQAEAARNEMKSRVMGEAGVKQEKQCLILRDEDEDDDEVLELKHRLAAYNLKSSPHHSERNVSGADDSNGGEGGSWGTTSAVEWERVGTSLERLGSTGEFPPDQTLDSVVPQEIGNEAKGEKETVGMLLRGYVENLL
ncbi:hypothetical protein RHMOL_Rhmol05G0137400 [Rhododendron molle]|uniref:Uncharacterized protein n=1 Tax=Rhododendron molle TaxID=49168 RepID=A0ACC0NPT7_RHOML|nr:hypothetical protein RHMOL_Rhmol05G0137400 [Rhododendron molle]